ncbi:arylamine N-acetyltransferase [Glycomyces sp. L485]|uniref:arylamine N-acetyltransferase family protein n=1 Tax=Glycomyces sp. L485 TaxID=2909235 RepID=UPI001F4BB961|nr:arylamine N-acetyltransferase [Glycomyces sp. L485]
MFTSSQLDAYLKRIGLARPKRPTVDALVRIHRAHIDTFPYENLDIQLGRPIRLEADLLFAKLVEGGRGGFCYEQNGVLALALESLGFKVDRVVGGVDMKREGLGNWYNHMPLVVRFPSGRFLADAGLGTGFHDPLPLKEGSHRVGPFNYGLWRQRDDLWRCTIDPRIQDLSFDFGLVATASGEFAEKCLELSTSPESGFVRTVTVQQPRADHNLALRSRTLTVTDPARPEGKRTRILENLDEFTRVLEREFGLAPPRPDVEALWEKACDQHERRLAEEAEKAARANR